MIWQALSLDILLNMSKSRHQISDTHGVLSPSHSNITGSVLVYLIVVILIFGILGVTMVSLFTTATTSSATPNDARRASSISESATRYAFSELRANDFDAVTLNDLNSTTYTVADAGSFNINIFSTWFQSNRDQFHPADGPLTLIVPAGTIPAVDTIPLDVHVINVDFLGIHPVLGNSAASISSIADQTATTLNLILNPSFNVNKDRSVCLAVRPAEDQTVSNGGLLYIDFKARSFFPKLNGAIYIQHYDYYYEQRIDDEGNNRVELRGLIVPPESQNNLPVSAANDYVILSPRNYMVIPTGTSNTVTVEGTLDDGLNIYDAVTSKPMARNPDIETDEFTDNINPVENNPDMITSIPDDDALDIGGGHTPGPGTDFGAGWYSGNQSIGGDPNVCTTGRCIFGLGIRVFFTLNYTGAGDGFTFTMMNADPTDGNDITSIGGDPQGSELLAYAGDSRVDPAGTAFLDGNNGRGIVPPKMAVEFDAKTNFDQDFEDEVIKNYCNGPNLRQDTRNDPLPDGAAKDAVQFVYWADRNPIDIPCRPNGDSVFSTASYDDNRHAPSADPVNERDLFLADSKLDVTPSNNWLNNGPWAVRLEVKRSLVQNAGGNFNYNLRLWMRQCTQADCNDILGTFFQDTRIEYDYSALPDLPLAQEIELSPSDHTRFNRFLFGFTTATAPEDTQNALIEQFNLSFIRPNDPIITNDPDWSP